MNRKIPSILLILLVSASGGCLLAGDGPEGTPPSADRYRYGLGLPEEDARVQVSWVPSEAQWASIQTWMDDFAEERGCGIPPPQVDLDDWTISMFQLGFYCHDATVAEEALAADRSYRGFHGMLEEANREYARMVVAFSGLSGADDPVLSFLASDIAVSGFRGLSTLNSALNDIDTYNRTGEPRTLERAFESIVHAREFFLNYRLLAASFDRITPECATDFSANLARIAELREEVEQQIVSPSIMENPDVAMLGWIEKTLIVEADQIVRHESGIATYVERMILEFERNRLNSYDLEVLPTFGEAVYLLNEVIRNNPDKPWVKDLFDSRIDLRAEVYHFSPRNAMNALALAEIDLEPGVDYCSGAA